MQSRYAPAVCALTAAPQRERERERETAENTEKTKYTLIHAPRQHQSLPTLSVSVSSEPNTSPRLSFTPWIFFSCSFLDRDGQKPGSSSHLCFLTEITQAGEEEEEDGGSKAYMDPTMAGLAAVCLCAASLYVWDGGGPQGSQNPPMSSHLLLY